MLGPQPQKQQEPLELPGPQGPEQVPQQVPGQVPPRLPPRLEGEGYQDQNHQKPREQDWTAAAGARPGVTEVAKDGQQEEVEEEEEEELADQDEEEIVARARKKKRTTGKRIRFAPAQQLEQFKVISPIRMRGEELYDTFSPSSSSSFSSASLGETSYPGTRRIEDMTMEEIISELSRHQEWIEVQIQAHDRFFCNARGPASADYNFPSWGQ